MRKSPVNGLRSWIIQRVTAIYLLVFFLFLLGYFAFFRPDTYEAWRHAVTGTIPSIATIVFFIALLAHAWIGLRDIILDYVKPLPLRLAVLFLLAFSLVGLAAWVMLVFLGRVP